MRWIPVGMAFAAFVAGSTPAWAQEPGHPEHGMPENVEGFEGPAVETPAEPELVTVLGHEVEPRSGLYEITADVNVREGPGTDFARVAGLKEGDRVRVVGKPKGVNWFAVSQGGKTLGFVYGPILVPVVDGALSEPFFGSYTNPAINGGVACDYRFRFERKTQVEDAGFETADYEIRFRCASRQGAAISYAHMFLTEAPVDEHKGLHLIGLETRSIGDGYEEYLITSFLYHPKTGKLTFDGHSLPRFALPPKVQEFETTSIKDALQKALEASIASWTQAAWDTLLKKE